MLTLSSIRFTTWKRFSKIETHSNSYNVGGIPYNRTTQTRKKKMTENENNTGTFGEYVPESNHPVLQQLKKQIEELEVKLADKEATALRFRDKYRTAEYAVEAKLKELLDDENIELEYAKEIADIFDSITLTKQITIQYDITATATIEVPYGADNDDVAGSTYVERVEFYTDFEDAEVLETDQDVNDWRDVS